MGAKGQVFLLFAIILLCIIGFSYRYRDEPDLKMIIRAFKKILKKSKKEE